VNLPLVIGGGLAAGLLATGGYLAYEYGLLLLALGGFIAVGLPVGLWVGVHPVAGVAGLVVVASWLYETYAAGLLDPRIEQARELAHRARLDLRRGGGRLREVLDE